MNINCPSWRDVGLAGAGLCTQRKFGGRPSHGTCGHCLGKPVQTTIAHTHEAHASSASPSSSLSSLRVLLNDQQRRIVASRKAICETCEHAKRVHRHSVHCEGCGCAGLSFLNGKCPRDKWHDE